MTLDVAIVALPLLGALIAGIGNRHIGDHAAQWITSGLILLVAMMGAIVLTHRERVGVRRQRIADQVDRNRSSVQLTKVKTGDGASGGVK